MRLRFNVQPHFQPQYSRRFAFCIKYKPTLHYILPATYVQSHELGATEMLAVQQQAHQALLAAQQARQAEVHPAEQEPHPPSTAMAAPPAPMQLDEQVYEDPNACDDDEDYEDEGLGRRAGKRNGRGQRGIARTASGRSTLGNGPGNPGRQVALKGRSRRQQDMYAAQQGYSKVNGRTAVQSFDDRSSSARHPNSRRPSPSGFVPGLGRGGSRLQRPPGRSGRIDQDEAAEALLGMGFAYEVGPAGYTSAGRQS